jgi:hypothetical protein
MRQYIRIIHPSSVLFVLFTTKIDRNNTTDFYECNARTNVAFVAFTTKNKELATSDRCPVACYFSLKPEIYVTPMRRF